MKYRLDVVVALWALAALASGCEEPAMGRACGGPSDCEVTEFCLDRVCRRRSDSGRPADAGPPGDAGPPPRDAGPRPDGSLDAGGPDSGPSACAPDSPAPSRILFVGNSFTFTSNMPRTFQALAAASGFPEPLVESRAIGGQTLEGHRADTARDGAPARVMEGWDVVVLQEFSTRPTDSVGPAEQFKVDATYFYDLAHMAAPDVRVVLYETFARHPAHFIYPRTFADPADMQAQLRFHYEDCASRYIPAFASVGPGDDVEVARVGDAWELQLAVGDMPRLHAADDYHPNAAGAYLSAAVFFGVIYDRRSEGLPAIGVDDDTAAILQASADTITGAPHRAPIFECPLVFPVASRVAVDFGPIQATGWPRHQDTAGTIGPLRTLEGEATSITVTTSGFNGTQTGGRRDNTLGLPGDVSQDTLWVGSFDGHDAALMDEGRVTLRGVPAGEYELLIFASRSGDDGGNGRLTTYRVGAESLDLEVSDNLDGTALFAPVRPDGEGAIEISVRVSAAGLARFGYVGALVLTRLGP